MKRLPVLLVMFCLLVSVRAQEEDTVELSSFTVMSSRDRGYASQSDAYGTNVQQKPNVAVTLHKAATAVVMEVVLLNSADKPDVRNREIYATIKDLQQTVQNASGLRFERREIQLRGEARRKVVFTRGATTSYANVAVVAPLTASSDLFALVQQMRMLVSGVTPNGSTKIVDGTVGLFLESPEQYRQELLKKIFEDVAFVKSNLGEGFEVLPAGLDKPVRIRIASEKEMELWIDYSFSIRSVTELQHPRPTKG